MLLLVDANVLIDYLEGDPSVLQAVVRHLGRICVPAVVVDEVDGLDELLSEQLGLEVVEPSLEETLEAGAGTGPLSFEDRVCLLMARNRGWVCVTNDASLRRECAGNGVEVLWGLQLMVQLVAAGHLTSDDALTVARPIRLSNPRHITEVILARFAAAIGRP